MAVKFALVFAAVFLVFMIFSEATVVRRDAPASPTSAPVKNDLEDALNSIKQGFEEFADKIKNSEIYQNASTLLDQFGQKVKQQGDELVQKIKDNTASKN